MMGERLAIVVSAFIATLLQVFLAPHIAIGYAVPNFMAAFCIAITMVRSDAVGPALPFVLGLLYDLFTGGPVGAMAFTLTVVCMLASWLFPRVNNDTLFMAIAVVVGGVFVVELLYGMFFLLFGYASGFLEAFVYRILPCFVYNAVLACVIFLFVGHFMRPQAPLTSEIRHLK